MSFNKHNLPFINLQKKVIEVMESQPEFDPLDSYCKRNLVRLQQSRMECGNNCKRYYDKKFTTLYQSACYRAIYSHNWGKLLYLLKKCPPWEHEWKDINESALYVRVSMAWCWIKVKIMSSSMTILVVTDWEYSLQYPFQQLNSI